MKKQPDEPEALTNESLPSISESMEVQDAVTSTLATPFLQPIFTTYKTKAQKQREYRQRIAATRTPAQAAAARKLKNERQRKNRLRQATNLAIASGSLKATTTSSSCSGEESNKVQTRSQRQHAQQHTTTSDQPDATPFAEPITARRKTRAQIQREYRQRIAASKTPAQAAAAREARNIRDRNNRLKQAAGLAIASGSLKATTASSSRSGQRLNTVYIDTQRQLTDQQHQTLATEPAETTEQPSTSSDQIEFQEQSTWNTKWASSIMRFNCTLCLDKDFGYACSVCDRLKFKNDHEPITAAELKEPVLMLQMNEIKREPITIEIEADVKIKQELPEDPEPLEFNVPNCSEFQMNGLISPKIEIKCEIIEEDTEYILPVKQELIYDNETD